MNTRVQAQLADRVLGGDRDVVEEAEAHRPGRFGVVPRRTHTTERDVGFVLHQCPRHLARATGGVQRRAV